MELDITGYTRKSLLVSSREGRKMELGLRFKKKFRFRDSQRISSNSSRMALLEIIQIFTSASVSNNRVIVWDSNLGLPCTIPKICFTATFPHFYNSPIFAE